MKSDIYSRGIPATLTYGAVDNSSINYRNQMGNQMGNKITLK